MSFFLFIHCSEKHELDKLGEKIEDEVNIGHHEFLDSLFSFDAFIDRPIRVLGYFGQQKDSITQAIRKITTLSELIKVDQDVSYNVVFLKRIGATLTFSVFDTSHIQYVELEIKQIEDGLKIVDAYTYYQGISFSDLYIDALNIYNEERLRGNPYAFEIIDQVQTLLNKKEYTKAREIIDRFIPEYYGEKLIRQLQLSSVIRDTTFSAPIIIQEYINDYPDDQKFIIFNKLLVAFAKDDCEEIDIVSQQLSNFTGKDPVLTNYISKCKSLKRPLKPS